MSLMWAIYWIDVLQRVQAAAGSISFFSILAIVVSTGFAFGCRLRLIDLETTEPGGGMFGHSQTAITRQVSEFQKYLALWKRVQRIAAIIAVVCIIPATLIPSKQTMYAMGAAYAGQQIVDNPKVQELGGKAFEILNQQLDEIAGKKEESK